MLVGMAVFCPASAEVPKVWKLKVYFGMTDQTMCAHYDFDNPDSCEAAKAWFVEQAAWHGQNSYRCILESECP